MKNAFKVIADEKTITITLSHEDGRRLVKLLRLAEKMKALAPICAKVLAMTEDM
jgi:hypothetical protein